MTNQMYAVRINTRQILPHELGDVISIWNTYEEASADCEKRFKQGQKGVHVTTYDHISTSPTN